MKENNIKKPWFVRLFAILNAPKNQKATTISWFVMPVIVFICAYGYFKLQPIVPYEDVYDIAFYNYANKDLENVIYEIRDEESGINLKNFPENVSYFKIYSTNEGIEIYYRLDNNKIISQYNAETGKNTTQHSFEEGLWISIRMSNEFECIEKTSFIDKLSSQEEYQKEHNKKIMMPALELAAIAFCAFQVSWLALWLVLAIPVSIWKKAHKKAEE